MKEEKWDFFFPPKEIKRLAFVSQSTQATSMHITKRTDAASSPWLEWILYNLAFIKKQQRFQSLRLLLLLLIFAN